MRYMHEETATSAVSPGGPTTGLGPAVALADARLYEDALKKAERLEALIRTSARLAGTFEVGEILRGIAAEAALLLGVEGAGFRLLEGDRLIVRGAYGLARYVMRTPSISIGESLSGLVAERGYPIAVPDVREDQRFLPDHKRAALLHGVVSYLGVPVRCRDKPIGVLTVYGKERRPLGASEVSLLEAFAAQAAVTIENARLFQQEKERRRQLEVVRAVSEEITRELDLGTLLELINRRAAELVGAASSAVYFWDEASEVLIPQVWLGLGPWMATVRLRLGEGATGTVAERREGLIVNDFPSSPFQSGLFAGRSEITAIIAEPLLYRERLVGVITVNDEGIGRPFTEQDRDLLALFAAQATIAIENARLHRRLAEKNTELERVNGALSESARTDPLTQLGNRLRLREDLQALRGRVERYGHSCCAALCDLDFFKSYNDRYGHLAGDQALGAVARTITEHCRRGDRAYRYGGEEFLILLEQHSLQRAALAMNRVRQAVESLAIPHAGKTPAGVVTISAGLAALRPGESNGADTLLSEADAALYRAKENGRNRVEVFTAARP